MSRNVSVTAGSSKYAQNITIGPHVFQADEPAETGGRDAGPNAHELLMASLGACTTITVQCMRKENSGLFRECKPPCHTREFSLKTPLNLAQKLP